LQFYSAPVEWHILQQLVGHCFAETLIGHNLQLFVRDLILAEMWLLVFQQQQMTKLPGQTL
jgi:hypothetical protein